MIGQGSSHVLPHNNSEEFIMPTPSMINKFRYSDAINRRYWDQKYFFDSLQVQPISAKVGGGAATGTAGDNNVLYTKFNAFEYWVLGTQTTLAPSLDAFGLNLAMTGTTNQGLELNQGETAVSPALYTIGTSNAFFMRCEFQINDVTKVNPFIMGFRKIQTFTATLASYTDFATIGIVGTAGHLQTKTQVATGGVTTTDSGVLAVNATSYSLGLYVDGSGNVTYQINDQPVAALTAVPFQFANATQVVPFLVLTDITTVTQASIRNYEVGFQS